MVPRLERMRSCVIHSDANTYNLVVQGDEISGLIDFGDMLFAKQVNELAIALAAGRFAAMKLTKLTGEIETKKFVNECIITTLKR